MKRIPVRAATPRSRLKAIVCAAAVLVSLPAAALAGRTVTAGHQTLTVNGSFTPSRAGAGSQLKLHVDYESTLPGQHVQGRNKEVQLQLPEGSHINPQNYAECPFSLIGPRAPSEVASLCPKDSVIGGGKFTADARPAVAQPVTGTITFYNVQGRHHDVLLVAKTKFGTFSYLFLYSDRDFDHDGDNDPLLDAAFNDTGQSNLFNLKTIDVTIGRPHHKPFITNPKTCRRGGWTLGFYISTYGGEPPIQATTQARCTSVRRKKR